MSEEIDFFKLVSKDAEHLIPDPIHIEDSLLSALRRSLYQKVYSFKKRRRGEGWC